MILAATWTIVVVLALLWTGGAALTAAMAQWASQALAGEAAVEAGRAVAAAPLPQWMGVWVDPALVQAAQSALLWVLETFRGLLPLAGTAAGWLVPLVWVLWGVGLAVLLVGAGAVHALVRRAQPRRG